MWQDHYSEWQQLSISLDGHNSADVLLYHGSTVGHATFTTSYALSASNNNNTICRCGSYDVKEDDDHIQALCVSSTTNIILPFPSYGWTHTELAGVKHSRHCSATTSKQQECLRQYLLLLSKAQECYIVFIYYCYLMTATLIGQLSASLKLQECVGKGCMQSYPFTRSLWDNMRVTHP